MSRFGGWSFVSKSTFALLLLVGAFACDRSSGTASSSTPRPSGIGKVTGTYVDDKGAPIADAPVKLLPPLSDSPDSSVPKAVTKTDRAGNFSFDKVPSGCRVVAGEGLRTVSRTVAVDDGAQANLTLKVRKMAK
jgi:hypothetical protein